MPPRPSLLLAAAGALASAAPLAAQAPAPASAPAAPPRAAVAATLDSLARDAVAAGRFSSVAVGVVRGRDTLLLAAHGLADREANVAATPATEYRLASVTKQFTAALALQLAGEGKLALEDTVGRWLPQVPAAWRGVTVAQLLNHTSGIPSYTALGPAWARRWAEDLAPDTLLALTYDRPMDFAPGTAQRYNNTGYVLLGRIVEAVAGAPYADVVRDRLARPLGLAGLGYCPTTPSEPTQARPYERGPGGAFTAAPALSMTHPYAAGALCASVRDVLAWNAALHGGRVVPAALYARMTTPEGAAMRAGYAYGIGRDTLLGRTALSHNGGIHGGSTEAWWFPDDSTSVVVLANTGNGGEIGRLARQLARAAFGAPLVPRPAALPLPAAERARYVGRYELAMGERTLVLDVRAEGDGLVAQAVGQGPLRLVRVGEHAFMPAEDEGIRLHFTVEGDAAAGLVLEQGGRRTPGKRVAP